MRPSASLAPRLPEWVSNGRVCAPATSCEVGSSGLRTRPLRTALSTVGIAIGIAAMVAVLGLSASSQADLNARIAALGTNLLQVEAGEGFGRGSGELPDAAVAMVRRIGPVTEVSSIAPTRRDSSTIERDLRRRHGGHLGVRR